jgi:hypothetical protein
VSAVAPPFQERSAGGETSILDLALDYARRGWPVFPCNPDVSSPACKQPLVPRDRDETGGPIPKTGGLYKATTDEAQISAWWRKWPDGLIGVRMGRQTGVFAIDPDAPKAPGDPDGLTAWHQLVKASGGIPPTHTHKTPSGGLHVLFRWREDRPVGNREGRLPRGINVRGDGGYIIVPPSRLSDGRRYGVADPLDHFHFADAPDWLYDLILSPREPEVGPCEQPVERAIPGERRGEDSRRYVAAAIERECRAVAVTFFDDRLGSGAVSARHTRWRRRPADRHPSASFSRARHYETDGCRAGVQDRVPNLAPLPRRGD